MEALLTILFIGLLLIGIYYTYQDQVPLAKKETEPFEVSPIITNATKVPDGVIEEIIGSNVTYPNDKNPFMNVLVDEIKYNPKRAQAASVFDPSVNAKLDDFFKTQFVNDPTDVFGKSQSQRQFYTTPSTTVPNDQDSYQNWLYRIPGLTCKEGGREACYGGTEGAVVPYLNNAS